MEGEITKQWNYNLLHGLETFHDHHAHVHVSLGTIGKAGGFARAELAARGARDAFIPTYACKLPHHLTNHCFLFLLLHKNKQTKKNQSNNIQHRL